MEVYKRVLWIVIAVVVVVAALFLFQRYHPTPMASPTTPSVTQATPPPASTFGKLKSFTATSITITQQNGIDKTFAISSSTPFITTVEAGQLGETLAQTATDTLMIVIPSPADPTVAQDIQVLPMLATAPPVAGVTVVSVSGVVTAKTPSTLTVQTSGSSTMSVAITSATKVLSNVVAGQMGVGLSAIKTGTTDVNVSGTQDGNTIAARTVQILIPLSQVITPAQ